jgi:hypothetical protein
MKIFFTILLLQLFFLTRSVTQSVMAQNALISQTTVKGKITDKKGETLIGASIAIKGWVISLFLPVKKTV